MKFANDKTAAKTDSKILRYAQPACVTSMQYIGDLYSKSCKVADIYEEATLNDIFFLKFISSI